MKSIFVLVSVLALMYLGAQTKTFTTWWESSFLPPSLQVQKSPEFAHKAPVTEQTQVELQTAASEKQLIKLTEQVSLLTEQVERLESKLIETQSKVNKGSAKSLVKAEQNNNLVGKNLEQSLESPTRLTETSRDAEALNINAVAEQRSLSEQDKRIKQQAILRDLARKMELASLSSLSAR